MLPGLPGEKRRVPCIPFKIIVQSSSIEYLPHCIDFTDNPSHQLEAKAISVNQLLFSCWYCNLCRKPVGNLLPIYFFTLNSTYNVLHILIADLQNKVIVLAFVVRKYSHNTN